MANTGMDVRRNQAAVYKVELAKPEIAGGGTDTLYLRAVSERHARQRFVTLFGLEPDNLVDVTEEGVPAGTEIK